MLNFEGKELFYLPATLILYEESPSLQLPLDFECESSIDTKSLRPRITEF